LLSAFILAGCNNDNSDTSSKELTVKELFEVSIQNAFAGFNDYYEFTRTSGESTLNFNVDKLTFGETDLTKLGEISITGNASADGKNMNSNEKLEINMFGETIPLEITQYNGEIFFVNMLGLNEKPIKLELPELTEGEDSAAGVNSIFTNSEKAIAVMEHVAKSLETAINANIDDSAFSAEDKDVTVLGTEFKNAKVITLTIDKAKIAKMSSDLIDELMKNEDIKTLFGEDFDKSEDLPEDFKSLRIVNTVVDETSVALSAYIDLSTQKESAESATESEADVETEDETFGIDCAFVGKNFSLNMGFVNEDGKVDAKIDGAIVLDVKDDGSKFSMSFKIVEDDETEEELITVKADITDGRYEGTVYLNEDNTGKIEIDFFAKGDKNEGEFGITEFTVVNGEDTQVIPLEIAFDYKSEEDKITLNGEFKLSIEETAEIEMSFNTVGEYKDVTIEPVTDSVPMDEIDSEELMSDFSEKYPTAYAFISMLGGIGGNGGSAEKDEQYFENQGFGIWLPTDFYETEMEGYTTCYTNDEIAVILLREDFEIFASIENFDFDAYVDAIYDSAADSNPSDISYNDNGTPYFEYTSRGFGYFVTMFEGEDAYWLVQFACAEASYEDNKANFSEWAYYADPFASNVNHTDGEAF